VPWYVTPDATIQGGARFLPSSGGGQRGVPELRWRRPGVVRPPTVGSRGRASTGPASTPSATRRTTDAHLPAERVEWVHHGVRLLLPGRWRRRAARAPDHRGHRRQAGQHRRQPVVLSGAHAAGRRRRFQANATLQAKVVASGGVAPTVTSCGTAPSSTRRRRTSPGSSRPGPPGSPARSRSPRPAGPSRTRRRAWSTRREPPCRPTRESTTAITFTSSSPPRSIATSAWALTDGATCQARSRSTSVEPPATTTRRSSCGV